MGRTWVAAGLAGALVGDFDDVDHLLEEAVLFDD